MEVGGYRESNKMDEIKPDKPPIDPLEAIVQEADAKLKDKANEKELKLPQAESSGDAPDVPIEAQFLAELPEEAVKEMISGIFDVIGKRDEDWKLTEIESKNLAKSLKRVLDKYNVNPSPEMTLLIWLGVIFIPRFIKASNKAKQEKTKTIIDAKALEVKA